MEDLRQKYEKYIKWQENQHTPKQKLRFLALQELFHLIIMPSILFLMSILLDNLFKINDIIQPTTILLYIIDGLMIIFGLFLSLWTRWTQYKIGQGTPAPNMPTQKLIIKGPYVMCRNPMILGDVIWLVGLSLILKSISFITISIFWFIGHLIYYKTIEEKELVARFGEEYVEYKKRVSFIIPFLKFK